MKKLLLILTIIAAPFALCFFYRYMYNETLKTGLKFIAENPDRIESYIGGWVLVGLALMTLLWINVIILMILHSNLKK